MLILCSGYAIMLVSEFRLNMTEKLFTGTLNHNQNKQKTKVSEFF